jgi:uncharacterized protein YbjT (DUF2867 family)
MNLLILGGTIFLGRHLVEAALRHNHQVTLFNRGRHQPELFPEVEKLRGDRDGGLEVMRGRQWDAVIDTSGYVPRLVQASAEILAGAVKHYTFISSISVYANFSPSGNNESTPLQVLADPTVETVTPETYGGLKALCEQTAEAAMPGRVLKVRAGLLVGPYDPIPRFAYWLRRVSQGGEVLAPGRPDRFIQLIDARDLAEWIIHMAEANLSLDFALFVPYKMSQDAPLFSETRGRNEYKGHWAGFRVQQSLNLSPSIPLEGLRAHVSHPVPAGLDHQRQSQAWLRTWSCLCFCVWQSRLDPFEQRQVS